MQHESRTAALLLLVFALGLALGRTGDHRHAAAPPTATGTATVAKVTDGDTVWLSPLGKVRLIGIDTPEVYGHTDCFGPEASAFADRVPYGAVFIFGVPAALFMGLYFGKRGKPDGYLQHAIKFYLSTGELKAGSIEDK